MLKNTFVAGTSPRTLLAKFTALLHSPSFSWTKRNLPL